jgi:hypothetical protein
MKKHAVNLLIFGFGATLLFGTSCGSDEEPKKPTSKKEEPKDTVEQDPNAFTVDERRLPTPKEFFDVIRMVGGTYRGELLAPLNSNIKFPDNRSRALMFGVYSADLAYISSFEFGTNALAYLNKIDEMAKEMDLEGIFDKELRERIMKNDGNLDSLFIISDVAYQKSIEYLQMGQMEDILGLMLTGGWIESMYIVSSSAGKYDEKNPIFDQLKGQYLVLETILEYLEPYSGKNDFMLQVFGMMSDLRDAYYSGGTAGDETQVTQADGMLVLSGGQSVVMNAEVYGKIVEKIAQIRKLMISNEI